MTKEMLVTVTMRQSTYEECYERFLANLDDAGLSVSEFLWVKGSRCHLTCGRDWSDDRWLAIDEADRYFFLLGGRNGIGFVGPATPPRVPIQ